MKLVLFSLSLIGTDHMARDRRRNVKEYRLVDRMDGQSDSPSLGACLWACPWACLWAG